MTWLQLILTYPGFTITMLVFGAAIASILIFVCAILQIVPKHEL